MSEIINYTDRPQTDNNNVSFYDAVSEFGDKVTYIRISSPGISTTIIEEPVNDYYKAKYPKQWDEYNNVGMLTGTPFENWKGLPDPMLQEMKRQGFNFVEQLANAPDSSLLNVMGGATWRKKARDFLDANRVTPEMIISAQQEQIAELQAQMKQFMSTKGR